MKRDPDIGRLTISRNVGESVLIGDDIEVTIAEVHGQRVSVTVTAPKSLRITRPEAPKR